MSWGRWGDTGTAVFLLCHCWLCPCRSWADTRGDSDGGCGHCHNGAGARLASHWCLLLAGPAPCPRWVLGRDPEGLHGPLRGLCGVPMGPCGLLWMFYSLWVPVGSLLIPMGCCGASVGLSIGLCEVSTGLYVSLWISMYSLWSYESLWDVTMCDKSPTHPSHPLTFRLHPTSQSQLPFR